MANPLDVVTQDDRDDDSTILSPDGLRRVPIYKRDVPPYAPNPLTQAVAPPQDDIATMIAKIKDRLLGTGGQERYQTWPERMVRSGLTLPGDVLSGAEPMNVTDPDTGETRISPRVIERAMDMAGLAGGGALTAKPGAGTLGSGPLRTGAKAVSTEPAPILYSALEHATANAAQDVMAPQQWLGYLKNQPGVKQEELAWTGLPEWLGQQKGKVKKEDVQQYLDEHKVEIKDVTKSANNEQAVNWEELEYHFEDEHGRSSHNRAELERYAEDNPDTVAHANETGEAEGNTKYSSYQLPGGENYREHLLTMPHEPVSLKFSNKINELSGQHTDRRMELMKEIETKEGRRRLLTNAEEKNDPVLSDLDKQIVDQENQRKVLLPYRSSHWDEPNVLAHVRTNDRTIDGQKSLHIEEIQSDWHQQGRKQGHADPSKVADIDSKINELTKTGNYDRAEYDRLIDERARAKGDRSVPDAPFKTTWPELALKRMIRHAAENGYDRISWTPGEAQAARYDLSKSVDNIRVVPAGENRNVTVNVKSGVHASGVVDKTGKIVEGYDAFKDAVGKNLSDVVGKDVADKILGTDKVTKLEGNDLKVGGEGMREFYDKMLPKIAEKIGKAHGVKVKTGEIPDPSVPDPSLMKIRQAKNFKGEPMEGSYQAYIPGKWEHPRTFKTEAEAKDFVSKQKSTTPVHYFDLPQSLKDHAIGKGFPLYMSGVPFPLTPVDYDPFKKENK